ncbi:diguanylate cyclase domain-containing protein [Algiphilus sp.]|uniref:diguanylate cyclase domain-containing protein n=1 Tax=Algiphilus sp. TaxID=1872431 RepID=UPI003B528818
MNHSIEQRLFATRHVLVDRLLAGLVLIALVGVPASLSRIHLTGWLPLYGVHIALGFFVVALFLVRARLSWQLKAGLILAVFWFVGLGGLINLGILGFGTWWLVMSALVVAIVYSVRAAMLVLVPILVAVALTGWGFVTGVLSLPFDANAYLRDASTWSTMAVGFVLLPVLVFLAVAGQNRTILGLLREVEFQRTEIERLAVHDELTGVPRAKLAMERLEHALRHMERDGGQLALLFIDLDAFKAVNDSYGHEAGDLVLIEVAQRFKQSLRERDTLGRSGGDEFIVILEGVSGAQEALKIAETLIQVIRQPVVTVYGTFHVGASIGVALSPQQAKEPNELVQLADTAMYRAKRAGKDHALLAEPEALAVPTARKASRG